jgi:PAS domain S-box-containing protein
VTPTTAAGRDERILVLMPTEKDAGRTVAALAPAGLAGVVCKDLGDLCRELADGAGALLLTEEAILRDKVGSLAATLRGQPAWSAVPLIVLAHEGGDAGQTQELFAGVGANVTLVERPVRIRTLLSVIQAALRTRRQQYEIRDALAVRERQATALAESERQLSLIYNNTSDCLYLARVEPGDRYTFLSVNETFLKVSGYTRDNVVGRPMEEIVPAPNHELVRAKYREVIRTRRPLVYLETADLPAGRRYGEITLTPILGPHGAVTHLLGSIKDVTDQMVAEERLRESEERAAFVRRSSGVGFWYCDLPFDVLHWDERTKAHFHLPPDARVTIDTFYARLHPDDREPTRRAVDQSIDQRAPYDVDYRTVDPATGAEKWIRAIGRTAYAADGTPLRFDGVTIDVTDRKRADEAARRNEAWLRTVTDSLPALVSYLDRDLHYRFANRAYEDWFGLTPRQVVGKPSWEVIGEAIFEHRRPYMAAALAGEFVRFEGVTEHNRLGLRFTEVIYTPHREAGQVAGFFVHVLDVTDRKRADAALAQQTDRLRLLWESASVLLTTDEPDAMMRGLFTKIAPHFQLDTYFNFMVDDSGNALHLESCIGIPDEAAREIRRLEFGQAVCGNVALHRRPITATFIQQSDDPKVQLVKSFGIRAYACNPLLAGDRLLGTLSFASRTREQFDAEELEFLATITRYVTVAYERIRLVRELRETDRRKDEFLALLAHELRNPLAPLRNGLHVMRLSGDNPEAAGRLRAMMERQLAHMVRLIDDLLDVSRISRNKMELRRSRVLLSDVISNAVETARPLVEAAGHELSVALPTEPVFLDADLTRLSQVFGNLLTNSAKYTEAGGHIWLNAVHRDGEVGEVVVSVRDTGIGIPAEALPAIFDMFSQVDRSLERSTGGLGIGLALVRGLVEMHGGSVAAASDGPGCGSTFTVRLPVLKARPELPSVKGSELTANGSGPRRRILVVDDNRDSAETMAALLGMLGNDVVMAHDGIEAVEAAERVRPEVVLMDVGMPRLNGYEATRRIREQPWGSEVAIIALTGWGQDADRAQSRAAGCDGHLVKPVSLPDLQSLLAELTAANGR